MTDEEPNEVTAEELFTVWMRPDAYGMIEDQQRKIRIILTESGSYYATFADIRAWQARHDETESKRQ